MGSSITTTSLPERLDETFNLPPKLTPEQCGHIRHIHNLVSQEDGDWAFFGAQEPGQEWDTARRYQLGHMAYAVGAAHYHHLPVMREAFKSLLERVIKKMLHKEVWDYWYLSSQSGVKLDPDLKELRKPWVDPVCRENIMYSGHLLLMVSLYTMLFHDHRYDEKDSILFDWNPVFWGMGRETYGYTRMSLQQAIVREMEREKWMGVCCEPNMIFIVCNQFPIIAFRYNDVINQTHVAEDVLKKYKAAWAEKGMVSENGLFRRNYYPNQGTFGVNDEVNHTVWASAYMPWNYEWTQSIYPSVADGFLEKVDGRTNIRPPILAHAIRDIVKKEGGRHDDHSVIQKARDSVKGQNVATKRFGSPTFGHLALWVSEYGDPSDLDSLLRHADTYMNPSWSQGGLYYRRSDSAWDKEGNYTYVEPVTGNACIAYARLNVQHGQKKMWDEPWTKEQVEARPYIDDVYFDQGIDCLRGCWDEETKTMIATFRSWSGAHTAIKPKVKKLPPGKYGVYVDGKLKKLTTLHDSSEEIEVDLDVTGDDVDLIVVRDQSN